MSKKFMNKSGLEYLWQKIKLYISNMSTNNIYPVGSIYMNVNNTNPATLFGGTWEQLKDRFLLGAGDIYQAGNIGGEATHILTKSELPNIMLKGTTDSVKLTMDENGYSVFKLWGKQKTDLLSENLGSGQAHNNMPPYRTVYIWERTA